MCGKPMHQRLAAVVGIALVTGSGCAAGTASSPLRAHDFSFEDINPRSASYGSSPVLSDLYAERGLVLQFVASWCEPCRDELPDLQRLYASAGVPVLLVAADEHGVRESILIVAKRSGLTAPILFVPEQPAQELERHYGHEILPATYFIDAAGRIIRVHEGALSGERMARAVEETLGLDVSGPWP